MPQRRHDAATEKPRWIKVIPAMNCRIGPPAWTPPQAQIISIKKY
jgi:hypothetical protein